MVALPGMGARFVTAQYRCFLWLGHTGQTRWLCQPLQSERTASQKQEHNAEQK